MAQKRAFLPSVRITESWLSWFVRNTTFALHVYRWRNQFSWRRSVRDLPHPIRSDFLLLRHCHLACHHPRPVCHLLLPISLMDTHTHTRLTAVCPGRPGWAGTRKVKPIWILLKQETVSGSGISWAICKSAPRSRQITTPAPHHSVFYRPDALPAAQPRASMDQIEKSVW